MSFRTLKYNYHDGQLSCFSLGPRNEVTLEVRLDPVWNPGGPSTGRIRFGAIENLNEVRTFLEKVSPPRSEGAFLAEVIGIIYEHKARWILDLSVYGSVVILAKHCDEL
jgi:hypothetical protein